MKSKAPSSIRLLKCIPAGCLLLFLIGNAAAQQEKAPAGNDEVRKVMESFKGRGTMRDDTPPSLPQEALKSFKMRAGFTIDLMASEPETE
ncbi:hypothetical protein BH11VER1_BH11VER1_28960 [soil metagenome]